MKITDNKPVAVVKASGEKEPFTEEKLIASLERSGASIDEIEPVLAKIRANLHEDICTRKIYKMAYRQLKQGRSHIAARYRLKNAILELGPSGYPFEKLITALFEFQGYEVKKGIIIKGKCLDHEVDVEAKKGNEHLFVECKFRNKPAHICDVKIPLYVQSRFIDIATYKQKSEGNSHKNYIGWVATNGRFSEDAMRFASCMHLRLLGWDYPKRNGLKDLIGKFGLYPITCLTTLTAKEKKLLLEQDVLLCKELLDHFLVLKKINVSASRLKSILGEVSEIC